MKRFIVFAMLTMAAGVAGQIIPPAIKGQDVTVKGEIYTLAGRADYQATHDVRDELIKRMNETVVLGGTVVKKGSTQLLYVNTIDGKAVDPKP